MARITHLPGEALFAKPLPGWKRAMDLAGSAIGLLVFSPLILLMAAYIKIISPGPVFFKQKRLGYRREEFTMWKFRTMRPHADTTPHGRYVSELIATDQPMTKSEDDPQIIPLGKLIRKCCLDELPQLINVLRGDMSLVGPRPDPTYLAGKYRPWYHARFDVTPGMTGLWQVSGKSRTTFNQMIRFDITYARSRSFWLDARILLMTVPAIISQIQDRCSQPTPPRIRGTRKRPAPP